MRPPCSQARFENTAVAEGRRWPERAERRAAPYWSAAVEETAAPNISAATCA